MAEMALKAAERITNTKFSSIKKPLSEWPEAIQPVFTSGTSFFIKDMSEVISEFIPLPKQIALMALKSVGVKADTPGTFLPLRNREKVVGCLSIWGKTLKKSEMKTYMLFASQVASTLEHARLLSLADQKSSCLLTQNH
jgi:hypothetical protein